MAVCEACELRWGRYEGAVRAIVQKEGPLALYHGLGPTLMGVPALTSFISREPLTHVHTRTKTHARMTGTHTRA